MCCSSERPHYSFDLRSPADEDAGPFSSCVGHPPLFFKSVFIFLFIYCILCSPGLVTLSLWVLGKLTPPHEELTKVPLPLCKLSLHCGNCFLCFKLDSIPFVNPCYYFLSYRSSLQKALVWEPFLPKSQSLKSYIKVIDPCWIDFCMGWATGIWSYSSMCRSPASSEPGEASFPPTSILIPLLRVGCCNAGLFLGPLLYSICLRVFFFYCSRISYMRIMF